MKRFLPLLEVLLYVIMFLVIQMVVTFLVTGMQLCITAGTENDDLTTQIKDLLSGTFMPDATGLIIISVISSVLTLLLFLLLRWAPVSPT